jgi:endonuclease/exonuclease/phosphatase family metal-dependent hydrolase
VRRVRRHPLPATHRHAPAALLAALDHPAGPPHAAVACVGWEPAYADDQLAQVRTLACLLADPALDGPHPVLLTADLNAAPGSPAITALTDFMTDFMIDCWAAAGGPDVATLSRANPFAPEQARAQIDRRIDYVLARPGGPDRPLAVREAFAVDAPVDGVYLSDHATVVVDLDG